MKPTPPTSVRFGTFITPLNSPPHHAVDLAVHSERLGYDLVTFQDHPYQPRFLDTWTLLSYVAARTQRVELSGNVLNLPLRQPAVLARSVASLDLLSGGRMNLGIGAGGFWQAIEAMGGPHRSGGEAVTALTEAVEIIRAIWDAEERGGVRIAGEHYTLAGAKRGPAPAHPVPVWLGAYGPRMLGLVGRYADGWLPSLQFLKPGDLARGNRLVDAAATAAGRDPATITRLLNIGPDLTAEQILTYHDEDRVSVFIVAADDVDTLERFAAEVIPAVRDRLA